MTKKFILLISILGCLMNLAACSPYVTWKEDVKINDGRVIVVEQKKRAEGPIALEAWLTINLPEFSSQPMVWHENLLPLVVNIDEGRLYVVGEPPTAVEARHYGCVSPPYVGFLWDSGKWKQIPFEKIPQRIYAVNMLLYEFPPDWTFHLTLKEKNSAELNGAPTHYYQRIINPDRSGGC